SSSAQPSPRQFRAQPPAVAGAFHDCHFLGSAASASALNVTARTLLGNPQKRAKYFDRRHHEYFFDRHRPTFEAIFKLLSVRRQAEAPAERHGRHLPVRAGVLRDRAEVIDAYKKDEGYISETVVLPEHPVKRKIWMLFEYPETSTPAFLVAIISVLFTVISIILFCVETLKEFKDSHCVAHELPNFLDPFFHNRVRLHRLVHPGARHPLRSLPAFIKDIKNAVDFSAIVPYYVTLTNVLITMSCEGRQVQRLARLPPRGPPHPGVQAHQALRRPPGAGADLQSEHRGPRPLPGGALIVCILLFSSTIYYVEAEVKGSQIESIPDAFWWAVITMCTVGYGDKGAEGPAGHGGGLRVRDRGSADPGHPGAHHHRELQQVLHSQDGPWQALRPAAPEAGRCAGGSWTVEQDLGPSAALCSPQKGRGSEPELLSIL
uniref:Ion_trans_2 domain-containing protein n=1 Tax=Macrostomum lignano TaxID=282301 RepID=A0A1I8G8Q8_9PLAT